MVEEDGQWKFDLVGTAERMMGGSLDAAFEAYKGKFWLDDLGDAAAVMDEVDKTLLRQGAAP